MDYVESAQRNFHIARIMNILLCQQTPRDDQDRGMLSSGGNFRLVNRREATQRILSSLFELGMVTWEEYQNIKKALGDGKCPCAVCEHEEKLVEEYNLV